VGNPLSSLTSVLNQYNSSNELTADASFTYQYDRNGNLTSKSNASGTTTLVWDFENRLSSVTLPNNGGVVTYAYDPCGRRISKAGPAGTAIYAYDGANVVTEYDASGNTVAAYTQGGAIDGPLAMSRSGAVSFYHADRLGSVTSMTNGTGSAVAAYVTDSFGKPIQTAGTVTNPFRYTARKWDSETNLYYYRARYYDAQIGRFISEDPAGFGAGNDSYVYVFNSPVNLTDPTGEDPETDRNITVLLNIFPGSELHAYAGGQYVLIHKPCFEAFRILVAQGFETGLFPPFNNPRHHAGGWEFRTRGRGPGFHFRMPYPPDPTDPVGMGSPLSPCPGSNCTLDQFHMDPNNPLGGNWWEHFKDFLRAW